HWHRSAREPTSEGFGADSKCQQRKATRPSGGCVEALVLGDGIMGEKPVAGGEAMILPAFLIDHPDGEIRLTGHRIGLYTMVREYQEGHSVEQIAEEYPSLPLELVRQVIAFYLANRSEVDAYVEACRAELARQAAAPPGPGVIKIRELMEKI